MKLKLNGIVIGFLLALCVVFATGAVTSETGRYQISSGDGCVWLVDTSSGSVWVSEKRAVETDGQWLVDGGIKWYSYSTPGAGSSN